MITAYSRLTPNQRGALALVMMLGALVLGAIVGFGRRIWMSGDNAGRPVPADHGGTGVDGGPHGAMPGPDRADISRLPVYTNPVDLELTWRPPGQGANPGEYTFSLNGVRVGDISALKRYIESLPAGSRVHPWYNEGRPRPGGTPDFRGMGLDGTMGTNRVRFGEALAQ